MRSLCDVLSWLAGSTAAALLALAVLAAPSTARADDPGGSEEPIGCYLCSECPSRPIAGAPACLQNEAYCDTCLFTCNCDPDPDDDYDCECNNE